MNVLPDGLGVALVTPFKNGEIDFPALGNIVEYTISNGADFLVVLGTTGEATTLSPEEGHRVIRFIVDTNRKRLPLVAGLFGGSNTRTIQRRLETFDLSGIDAVMSASPAYNKPSQEGIFAHYLEIARTSPLPIIIYNVPGRTASNVEPETIVKLAHANDKFIAVKEASADMIQGMTIMRDAPSHFKVYSGDDPTAYPLIASGANGLISVIGNAFPAAYSQFVHAAITNNHSTARRINNDFIDLHPWLYIDGNPAGVKYLLSVMGLCDNELRLPLTPMSPAHSTHIKQIIEPLKSYRT